MVEGRRGLLVTCFGRLYMVAPMFCHTHIGIVRQCAFVSIFDALGGLTSVKVHRQSFLRVLARLLSAHTDM